MIVPFFIIIIIVYYYISNFTQYTVYLKLQEYGLILMRFLSF